MARTAARSRYARGRSPRHAGCRIHLFRSAMAEIERVLMSNGFAILQVPLSERPMTEEEEPELPQEGVAQCSQGGHVKIYGDDLFVRLECSGLKWISVSPGVIAFAGNGRKVWASARRGTCLRGAIELPSGRWATRGIWIDI